MSYLVGDIGYASLNPILFNISVAFLVPTITIVLLLLFLVILIILFTPLVYKCSFSPILIVQVLETLVIYPHFKHLPMLHDVQTVVSNVEGVLE
jgi:hypothetical protein